MLRQAGFTEQRFIAEQRKVFLRRQLTNAMSSGITPPTTASQAFARFEGEERNIDYVALTPATAGDIAVPTPDVLAKYFEDRKVTFRAPEYRKLIVLALTPDEIAKSIEVSDDDAKQAYEARKARYATPEKRDIQQMIFLTRKRRPRQRRKLRAAPGFEVVASGRQYRAG